MLSRVLKNKKGFTLVELIVVMAIIGIISGLGFGGFVIARKEAYIKYVANEFQTDIRSTFIGVLSTKIETGAYCQGKPAKIKAVRVALWKSDAPISLVSFCENSSGVLINPDIKEIDLSTTGYKQVVETKMQYYNKTINAWDWDWTSGSTSSSGVNPYAYFIFTSPYGKYYYYNSMTDYADASGLLANLRGDWVRNETTRSYSPVDTSIVNQLGDAKVYFDSNISSATGIQYEVDISQNGSVELK